MNHNSDKLETMRRLFCAQQSNIQENAMQRDAMQPIIIIIDDTFSLPNFLVLTLTLTTTCSVSKFLRLFPCVKVAPLIPMRRSGLLAYRQTRSWTSKITAGAFGSGDVSSSSSISSSSVAMEMAVINAGRRLQDCLFIVVEQDDWVGTKACVAMAKHARIEMANRRWDW